MRYYKVFKQTAEEVQQKAIAYAQIRNEQFREAAQRYADHAGNICHYEVNQTEEMAHEIEEFFRKNPVQAWERSIQQSIETVRLNAAMMARDTEKLTKYFQMK